MDRDGPDQRDSGQSACAGKVKPMIVVMETSAVGARGRRAGCGARPGPLADGPGAAGCGFLGAPPLPPPRRAPGAGAGRGAGFGIGGPGGGAYGQIMINDLIPWVDATSAPCADKDHRAMAGLSMGGRQTAPSPWSTWISSPTSAFSAAARRPAWRPGPWRAARGRSGASGAPALDLKTIYSGAMADPAEFNRRSQVLFMSYGSLENPDGLKDTRNSLSPRASPTATFTFLPAPRTNGRPGEGACIRLLRCCSGKTFPRYDDAMKRNG